jgi:hypothetical protein
MWNHGLSLEQGEDVHGGRYNRVGRRYCRRSRGGPCEREKVKRRVGAREEWPCRHRPNEEPRRGIDLGQRRLYGESGGLSLSQLKRERWKQRILRGPP